MLIEFGVANFRSIRARQELSMVASSDAAHLQRNVAGQTKELRLLRGKFGACVQGMARGLPAWSRAKAV